jgi:hypothetical protein
MPSKAVFLHQELSDQLNAAASSMRKSTRGVSQDVLKHQSDASKWLVESLYQGFCCLPRLPVALPLRSNAYSDNSFNLPFGYEVTIRILRAAKKLQFVRLRQGIFNPSGKGVVTRIAPSGPLRAHFHSIGTLWQNLRPPHKDETIFINEEIGGKDRRLANTADHPDVAKMQRNVYAINLFLRKQCIHISLPDVAFTQPADKFMPPPQRGREPVAAQTRSPTLICINFQNVFLHRIFTEGSFAPDCRLEGGRFYGGWWQTIRKEMRQKILINGQITTECDFSGMALNCLYAHEELTISEGDPYDLGLCNSSKEKRALIKLFIIALLNDKKGKFRLAPKDLAVLGLTHKQLTELVNEKHQGIRHHFGTGIGLYLQYLDSCVAEKVMLSFMRMGEVCLPIHDSFIVREGLKKQLETVMKHEYEQLFKFAICTTVTLADTTLPIRSRPRKLSANASSDEHLIAQQLFFSEMMDEYSIYRSYFNSWEAQTFDDEEIAWRTMAQEHYRNHRLGK